jgi:hypothetical protein
MSFLSKMTPDFTGKANNCVSVNPADQANVTANILVGETPFIYLKSAIAELIFTDRALITLLKPEEQNNDTRVMTRFNYRENPFRSIHYSTAGGTMDNDIEFAFTIGSTRINIDLAKTELPNLQRYCRVLNAVAAKQVRDAEMKGWALNVLNHLSVQAGRQEHLSANADILIGKYALIQATYDPESFADLFRQYLTQ